MSDWFVFNVLLIAHDRRLRIHAADKPITIYEYIILLQRINNFTSMVYT